MCSLYTKMLNDRLTNVVESHSLLGQVQNGFRASRCKTDNSFILDTVLWKCKAKNKKVHAAYLDISKAYDLTSRRLLWKKLSSIGISGPFLQSLKALYKNDSVDCDINGLVTRPIFLRRGLRQAGLHHGHLFIVSLQEIM